MRLALTSIPGKLLAYKRHRISILTVSLMPSSRATYRGKRPPPYIVHVGHDRRYTRDNFRAELKKINIKRSMSSKANYWDNAVSEGLFGSLNQELLHHEKYKTR